MSGAGQLACRARSLLPNCTAIAAFENGMYSLPVIRCGAEGGACDGIRPSLWPKDQIAQSDFYGASFNLPSMERGELHDRCVCLLLADYIHDIGAAKPNAKTLCTGSGLKSGV